MKKLKKFKITKKKFLVFAVIALTIGGVLFFRNRNQKEISTFTVQKGTVKEELILSGTVRTEKHAQLSFPTSGKIAWVGAAEGQKVYKWQPLVSLDKTVLNATYQQALNNYRNYQAAAENTLDTVKDNDADETFSQKATRTAAEVARDNAYDAVKAAKYNLDNATLFAPFSGILASNPFKNVGVNISANDALEIVDPESLYFETDADQSEVNFVKENQDVVIILDSIEGGEFKGKVTYVGLTPKLDESGSIYKVKVKFDNAKDLERLARVGMTGDARFILSQKENSLFAPPKFVNTDKNGQFVYLGKMGNRVSVKVGIEGEDQVEFTEGVKEGDVLYD